MVISIQLDANVVTAEIARGDKRGTRAAKWIIAELHCGRVAWTTSLRPSLALLPTPVF